MKKKYVWTIVIIIAVVLIISFASFGGRLMSALSDSEKDAIFNTYVDSGTKTVKSGGEAVATAKISMTRIYDVDANTIPPFNQFAKQKIECSGTTLYVYKGKFSTSQLQGNWASLISCSSSGCSGYTEKFPGGTQIYTLQNGVGDVPNMVYVCYSYKSASDGSWAWSWTGWAYWNYGTVVDQLSQEVLDLRKQLSDKQAEILSLQTTVAEKAQIIDSMNLDISRQIQIIDQLHLTVAENAQIINDLNLNIAKQADIINALTKNLEEKAYYVSQLQAENARQAELIQLMEESFDRQRDIIQNLNLTIADDAQLIKNLNYTIDQQAIMVNTLTDNLEDAKKLVAELSKNNQDLNDKLTLAVNKTQEKQYTIYIYGGIIAVLFIVILFLIRKVYKKKRGRRR